MRSYREEHWFNTPGRVGFVRITDTVREAVRKRAVAKGKKAAAPAAKKKAKKASAGGGGKAGCGLIGCKRPSRKKGYCGAHYQKYRMLIRTNRLPADWTEYAAPNSVADVVLPRGRAAAKARAAREG